MLKTDLPAAGQLLEPIYASHILIVDDVEVNRVLLDKILRTRGFNNIVQTENGKEALEAVKRHDPDIVILDVLMPEMDGFECCATLRAQEKYRDLPILIQTKLTEPEMRFRAFTEGATDVVSKPVDPDEFYARVMVHLEKRLYMQELQRYQDRIKEELDNARELQHSILPGPEEIEEVRRRCNLEMAAHFAPSSEIGGDFWGMKSLFTHQTAFWIVDFSGHGVTAALNAFRLQAYLKEHSPVVSRPGEYLSHLNEKLLHLLLLGQFATMFYAVIDTEGNRMFYASAGSTHPFILRRATGKVEKIDASGLPLGVSLNFYPTRSTTFARGDQMLLYSDALLETKNADGKCLDEQDIVRFLKEHASLPTVELLHTLVARFEQHTRNRFRDDLTLCLCRRG